MFEMSSSKVGQLIRSFKGFLECMASSNELTHTLMRRVEIMLFYISRYPLDCDKMESYALNSNSLDFQEAFIKENSLDVLIFSIKEILGQKSINKINQLSQQEQQSPYLQKSIQQDDGQKQVSKARSVSTNLNYTHDFTIPKIQVTQIDQVPAQNNNKEQTQAASPLVNKDKKEDYKRIKSQNELLSPQSFHVSSTSMNNLKENKNELLIPTSQFKDSEEQQRSEGFIEQKDFAQPNGSQLDVLINEVSQRLNEEDNQQEQTYLKSANAKLNQDISSFGNNNLNVVDEKTKKAKSNNQMFDQTDFSIENQYRTGTLQNINVTQTGLTSQQVIDKQEINETSKNVYQNPLQYLAQVPKQSSPNKRENKKSNLNNLLQDVRSNIQIMKSHTQLYLDLIREYHDSHSQQLIQKHQDLAGKYQYKFQEKPQFNQVDLNHSMKRSLKNIIIYTRKNSIGASIHKIENDLQQKLQQTKHNLITSDKKQIINTETSFNTGYAPGQQIESLSQRYMLNRQKNNNKNNDLFVSNNQAISTPINQYFTQQNEPINNLSASVKENNNQQPLYEQQVVKQQPIVQQQSMTSQPILPLQQTSQYSQWANLNLQQPFQQNQEQQSVQQPIEAQKLYTDNYTIPSINLTTIQSEFDKDKILREINSKNENKFEQYPQNNKIILNTVNQNLNMNNNILLNNNEISSTQNNSNQLQYQFKSEKQQNNTLNYHPYSISRSPSVQLQNIYSLESMQFQTVFTNNKSEFVPPNNGNVEPKSPSQQYKNTNIANTNNNNAKQNLDSFALNKFNEKKHLYIDDQQIY